MQRIHRLDADVVNKIAAGEVVERPASVVKELIENSLDAGATRVDVEIEGGGRDLIQVVDDGHGMSREDALLSLERHATSKLRDAAGLFSIASYGFRGEAVPAIASVSRLSMLTREPDALEGTRIEVEGGVVALCEPAGAPVGTRVTVRDLFFATPARRKFLKRAETESSHVLEAVIRLALARPDVGFSLRSGGRVVFRSPASSDVRERIAAAIGREVFAHLLSVEHEAGFYAVRGFVSSPNWTAPTHRAIYTFVNGRFVRDRQLLHAVVRACAEVLPEERFPCAVLHLDLPPGQVDVNVHPQKLEVRFADPRAAYDAIFRGVGEALRRGDWLQGEKRTEAPARTHEIRTSAPPAIDWHARARASARALDGRAVREAAAALWPRPGDAEAVRAGSALERTGALRLAGQLAGAFLLCEAPGGDLVVVDRHAARERVVLAELRAARARGAIAGQAFLFPATVELGIAQARALVAHRAGLEALGIDLEPFGGTTFALKAVPAAMVGCDHARVLADLAGVLASHGDDFDAAMDDLLAAIACHASGRERHALSEEEARALLEAFERADPGPRCLHGTAIVAEIGIDELEKRAGR